MKISRRIVRLTLCVGALARASSAPAQAPARLFKDSRGELIRARVEGQRTMTVVVAAVPDQVAAAASAITRLGGVVQVRNAAVGYLRVEVPVEHVEAVAVLPWVEAAEIDT